MLSIDEALIFTVDTASFIFSILLTIQSFRKKDSGLIHLGIFFFIMFLQIFIILAQITYWDIAIKYTYYINTQSIILFQTPFLLFYIIKNIVPKFKITFKSILHFLPGISFFVLMLILIINFSPENKALYMNGQFNLLTGSTVNFYYTSQSIIMGVVYLQTVSYTIFMIYLLNIHKNNILDYFSNLGKKRMISLKIMLLFILAFNLWEISSIFILNAYSSNIQNLFSLFYVIGLGSFGLIYNEKYPNVEYKKNRTKKTQFEIINKNKSGVVREKDIEYFNNVILVEMRKKKYYTDEQLNIHKLSEELNITKTQLSYLINEVGKVNFYEFINGFRIDYFKDLVQKGEHKKYSIDSLAHMSGFKSRGVFYRVFKQKTKTTPSKFIQDLNNHKTV